jgi:hypothetical protein
MHHRPVDDALEAGRRLGFAFLIEDEVRELLIDIIGQFGAKPVQIDIARSHHRRRIAVVEE